MYVLTALSPAMFGNGMSIDINQISETQAKALLCGTSPALVANRVSSAALAIRTFGSFEYPASRFVSLSPGDRAILVHYRGPTLGDDGVIPKGGAVQFYLIETYAFVDASEAA